MIKHRPYNEHDKLLNLLGTGNFSCKAVIKKGHIYKYNSQTPSLSSQPESGVMF